MGLQGLHEIRLKAAWWEVLGREFPREVGDMAAYPVVVWIGAMPMLLPPGGPNMDLHVTLDAALFPSDPQDRTEEVGPGLQVPPTGLFNDEGFPGGCDQVGRPKLGVIPGCLNVPF